METDDAHRSLAGLVGERCRLSGTFTLRSGQSASTYFDKYLFEADPALRAAGADLVGVLCVIDRSAGTHRLSEVDLELVSLFTSDELQASG